MSFLNMQESQTEDISQGTISLWFRFSQDSIEAAKLYGASYQPPNMGDFALGPPIFDGSIPLLTFGRKVMAHTYGSKQHVWSQTIAGTTMQAFSTDVVTKGDSPCEPSHLGLQVHSGGVGLKMVFQTATRAQVQGLNHQITEVRWEQFVVNGPIQQFQTVADVSYINTGIPETFTIAPKFKIAPDIWHHLLVSFNFTGKVDVVALKNQPGAAGPTTESDLRKATIKSYCKFWYAFDDVNGTDMGDGWVSGDSNGIITDTAGLCILSYTPQPPSPFVVGGNENPEYHWTASPLPMSFGPIGLPASAEYVGTIYHCELAEFQMWPGISIDTGDEEIRRLFIDYKRDENGEIIVDADGNAGLKPVDPKLAAALLGTPAILLHGSTNWQQGYNTGLSGLGEASETTGEAEIIPEGQFVPVGGIAKWLPDPSIAVG